MSTRKTGPDRRAEILQTALDLAFEIGPDRLATGMIADRLGLTQPAIYKHFRNKEDIWQGVADRLCPLIASNIAEATAIALPGVIRLRHLVLGHLRILQDHPALPEIMTMRHPTTPRPAPMMQIRDAMSEFHRALVETIEAARRDGEIHPDTPADDAAMLIFGILQALVLRLMLSRDPQNLLTEGERLLDLQLSLLRRAAGAA